jgi:hypothetical protein
MADSPSVLRALGGPGIPGKKNASRALKRRNLPFVLHILAIRPPACSNTGPAEGIMAYQINALFDDGSLLMSELLEAPTPVLGGKIAFWRDGRPVAGIVKKIQPRRIVSLHAPTRTIDEVHFMEVVEDAKVREPSSPSLWQTLKSAFAGAAG